MKTELNNKVIVVTGASRGIGKKMVERLSDEGAEVVINYKSDDVAAKELVKKIEAKGANVLLIKADVSKEQDVKALYKGVMENYGRIDVLINNAGICEDNYIQFMSVNKWDNVINTNLKGTFLCTRIFSKQMIKQRKGKVINISSLKGQLGSEGQSNYAASKAAVIAFTKSFAKEMGAFGISANVVCPGYILTDLNRKNSLKAEIAHRMSTLGIDYALEDLLSFLVWICSDNMNGISGQVFNLDSRIM